MTFEDFRRRALDTSRAAARRWEDPYQDEVQVLLGQDDYDAFHVVPVPPFYLRRERGHVHWLAGALPDVVANRSLRRIAFRSSAWASADPRYADSPVDDPKRTELLMLEIAEKDRYESWHAAINRSASGVPSIGDWELYASDEEILGGAVPKRIRMALDGRAGSRGPTMPAADMVLGPWDVPDDFFPWQAHCGPLDHARDTTSSYVALFRPESPGPVILSQAILAEKADAPAGWMVGAMEVLKKENEEFLGPSLGEESHYFEGTLDGGRLSRHTALWRSSGVYCEVAAAGPPGRFSKVDVQRYAALQDKRGAAALFDRAQAEH